MVSFVSGRNLAIFDPHCSALPSLSSADPGRRIDFVASRVADAHPDQVKPYKVGRTAEGYVWLMARAGSVGPRALWFGLPAWHV